MNIQLNDTWRFVVSMDIVYNSVTFWKYFEAHQALKEKFSLPNYPESLLLI
jgi:hypothetical protein